ncbi:hypothetical protein RM549_06115 [Salegentibacter sp. F188]|uniref:Uncharacterized protein n=1 Tax=Autumnicola patrickiae TaxID=3075591 RepID=A0ABU3E252_9FLAO|nr:hypothetical protein [Salegentibacter sp. F188]MDT0689352.1 hypothetical protein [Salegentibacter sp. F188]
MSNLLQIIEENANEKSGISLVQLAVKAGIGIAALKNSLNQMHREKKIRVREGINCDLVFLRKSNPLSKS